MIGDALAEKRQQWLRRLPHSHPCLTLKFARRSQCAHTGSLAPHVMLAQTQSSAIAPKAWRANGGKMLTCACGVRAGVHAHWAWGYAGQRTAQISQNNEFHADYKSQNN